MYTGNFPDANAEKPYKSNKKMIYLESEINKLLGRGNVNNVVGKTLSSAKNALNSSSCIVDAVHVFADNIENEIDEGVGGIMGAAAGWVAGKATKTVGGIGGGIIAGTLKTVAKVIPEATNPKQPEIDLRIANLVETYPLSNDKEKLFELVQWLHGQIHSNDCQYGKSAVEAFKKLHQKAFSMLSVVAKDDFEMIELAKSFAPKKKFGLFR